MYTLISNVHLTHYNVVVVVLCFRLLEERARRAEHEVSSSKTNIQKLMEEKMEAEKNVSMLRIDYKEVKQEYVHAHTHVLDHMTSIQTDRQTDMRAEDNNVLSRLVCFIGCQEEGGT